MGDNTNRSNQMKYIKPDVSRVPIKAWVADISEIEGPALEQLTNLSTLPFIAPNGVAVMPDVHAGKGSTVGTVIATDKAIIPAAVGVDIGCGMNAVRLSIKANQLPDSLAAIRSRIESLIPVGNNNHLKEDVLVRNRGILDKGDGLAITAVEDIVYKIKKDYVAHAAKQLGTLGGGNHFVELCIDENQDVWVMLHSGSRGVGNVIGSHYIEAAKDAMSKYFIHLPDQDLAYLPEGTKDFDDYVKAVSWAQDYAMENRKQMMLRVIDALRIEIPIPFDITQEAINCHHNYVEKENHFGRNLWVTRKGAIRAREGDLGIIPGSMGAKSFIVRGKGNPESYCSCSHGAGRKMSRAKAKQTFTVADLIAQTAGVECLKTDAVLDEIPGAYKDIEKVMNDQTELVEVLHTLKQVMCIKGN
jgi:tRNA-splicing ligase RtcB (3'-phosphate/5'-hydroxy nucleic acid ligase)